MFGLPARFMSKVSIQSNGCWLWNACVATNGYGSFSIGGKGKTAPAHRWAYEQVIGPVPAGLELDHFKCHNRRCANPWHVEPVTHAENMRRARGWSRWSAQHCAKGHPLSADPKIRKSAHGGRCKICHAAREKARYHERKSND